MNINNLYKIIQDRKRKMPKDSYVASLFKLGEDRIIQKVGEEATEVIIAAKNKDKQKVIFEVADLSLHVLVMLVSLGIRPKEISNELQNRSKKRINRNDKILI